MTDNQNPTDLPGPTTDALESVAATEQSLDPTAPTEQTQEDAAADGVPVEGDVEALLEVEDVVVGDDAIDDDTMRRALEAILMVTDEPLPALTLARTVGRSVADVAAALAGLSEEYTEQRRGFDLREVGGGWRYYTREDAAQYVERFVLDGQQARLTQAALETLAVVAYKQPVSRARVSAIRGVNVDGVMRTLITRGLVEEAGADTESQSTLYRTSSYFLERMGMQSLDDLPELAPYLPDMDDMEEELAAQAAPEASTTEDPEGPLENDLAPPPAPAEVETDDEAAADEDDDIAKAAPADDADDEVAGADAAVDDGDDAGESATVGEGLGELDAAGGVEGDAAGETSEVDATEVGEADGIAGAGEGEGEGEVDELADGDGDGDRAGGGAVGGVAAGAGSVGVEADADLVSGDDDGLGGMSRDGDDWDESGTRG